MKTKTEHETCWLKTQLVCTLFYVLKNLWAVKFQPYLVNATVLDYKENKTIDLYSACGRKIQPLSQLIISLECDGLRSSILFTMNWDIHQGTV